MTEKTVLERTRRSLCTLALGLCLAWGPGALADEGRTEIDAWPFLEIGEDTITILYPLYSKEGESVTSFPFYYRTNEGRDHHVLWPLAKASDGRVERVAPFWFRDDSRYTLFPLIHRTEDSTTLLFPPTHWRHDGDFVAVLPFYVRSGDKRFYAPNVLVDHRQRRDGSSQVEEVTVFPLFQARQDSSGVHKSVDVLILAHGSWGGRETEAFLLPLCGVRTGGRDDYVWLGPYYKDVDDHFLVPVFYSYTNPTKPEDHDRWLLTWREQRSPTTDVDAVYPFYAEEVVRMRGDRERTSLSVLWPAYRRDEVLAADGTRESRRRRFLMFTDERTADGVRRFEIFGLPISETVEEGPAGSATEA